MRAEIGGPDELSLIEIARQFQAARSLRRAILPVPLSDRAARGMGFVVSQGVRGTRSWADWLKQASVQRRSAA